MPYARRLQTFLDEHHVKYVTLAHSRAFTTSDIAARLHARGHTMAKAVVLTDEHENLMAVVPGDRHIDVPKLCRVLGGADLRLAREREFRDLFPDCEPGALPPFGKLFGLRTLCDKDLGRASEIIFSAGSHVESVQMAYADFVRLAEPEMAAFTKPLDYE